MRYRAWSDSWQHDHCEFCSAKFAESAPSGEEETLAEGYTTTAEHLQGAKYHWVCPDCAADFAEEFGWSLVEA